MTAERKAHAANPLDPVVLDHHVGEQLAAHVVERRIGDAVIDLELDQLAGADVLDAGKAQPLERMLDRAALRIEHAGLEADGDADFHAGSLSRGRRGFAQGLWPRRGSGTRERAGPGAPAFHNPARSARF